MIQNTQRFIQYIGNGVTTSFAISFPFYNASHIYLYKEVISTGVITPLVLTTDFTLTGLGNPEGGTALLTFTPPNDNRITIARIVPYHQTIDYINNDRFNADSHEQQMDLIIMMLQQLSDGSVDPNANGKALRFPLAEPAAFSTALPNPALRKNTVVGFDAATGECVLFTLPLVVVAIPPPITGTHVYGSVNGVAKWLETQNCP